QGVVCARSGTTIWQTENDLLQPVPDRVDGEDAPELAIVDSDLVERGRHPEQDQVDERQRPEVRVEGVEQSEAEAGHAHRPPQAPLRGQVFENVAAKEEL